MGKTKDLPSRGSSDFGFVSIILPTYNREAFLPDAIEAIRMQAFPHDGIGRPFKVSKGQIAGLTKAVELFMAQDESVEYARLMAKAEWMAEQLTSIPAVTVTIIPRRDWC